jgi:hypothetical protein
MSAEQALELSEGDRAAFELAVVCGLTRRFGPYPQEVAAMASWRQWVVRLLPRRHRWRLSFLAADIQRFERDRVERSGCHTPGVASGSTSRGEDG